NQHDGKDHSHAEAVEGILHGQELTAHLDGGAARQFGPHFVYDFLYSRAHTAEIAAVDVGIHVHYRLHVVVVDDCGCDAAAHGNHIREQLGIARGYTGVAVGGRGLVRSRAHARVGGVGGSGGGGCRRAVDVIKRRTDRGAEDGV